MRLSELQTDDVSQLLDLAGLHFRGLRYPDWWLLPVAGFAWSRGDQRLARECLLTFEHGRAFVGLEADVLSSLWSAFEPTDDTPDELIDETVVTLTEEGGS